MTATYVAWNGKSYPSPPPDGWYEASDGRWWAPGTGPNPPKPAERTESDTATPATIPTMLAQRSGGAVTGHVDEVDTTTTGRTTTPTNGMNAIETERAARHARATVGGLASSDNTAEFRLPTEVTDDGHDATTELQRSAFSQTPTDSAPTATPLEPTSQEPNSQERDPQAVDQQTVTRSPAVDVDPLPSRGVQPSADPPTDVPPALQGKEPAEPRSKRSKRDVALIAVVAIAVASAIGFGVAAWTADDDRATTEASSAPSSSTITESTAVSTIEAPSTEAPVTEAPTTTTVAAAAAATTTTLTEAQRVAQFRTGLDDRELSTATLTDGDIVDFGQSFCLFAIVSGDGDEFETYRQRAIAESTTDLTPEELTIAIDQAVASFCPQHAARLGLP